MPEAGRESVACLGFYISSYMCIYIYIHMDYIRVKIYAYIYIHKERAKELPTVRTMARLGIWAMILVIPEPLQ